MQTQIVAKTQVAILFQGHITHIFWDVVTSLYSCTVGLGFEDCSAQVTILEDTDLTNKKPYVKEHEQIKSRGWSYYAFNVTDDDYQIVVNVAEEEDSTCRFPQLTHRLQQLVSCHQYCCSCVQHDYCISYPLLHLNFVTTTVLLYCQPYSSFHVVTLIVSPYHLPTACRWESWRVF